MTKLIARLPNLVRRRCSIMKSKNNDGDSESDTAKETKARAVVSIS